MLNKEKSGFFPIAVIAVILIFSGCVGETPSQMPAPTPVSTPVPTLVTPVPTQVTAVPTTMVPTPVATPSVPPEIRITSFPRSVDGDTIVNIKWEVSGGTQGEISKTAIYWNYLTTRANISDYRRNSSIQMGKTPQGFSADIRLPSSGDFYFRAHAVVDGVDVYSTENRIMIIAPMGEGGY